LGSPRIILRGEAQRFHIHQFSEEMAEGYRKGAQSAICHHLKSYVEHMVAQGGVKR
jgi:hypothetical protein